MKSWGGVGIAVDTLSTLLGSLLLLSSHAFTMTGSGVLEVDTLSTLLGSLLLLSSHAFTMTGSGVLECIFCVKQHSFEVF